jgi:signal transduction histidine kinase
VKPEIEGNSSPPGPRPPTTGSSSSHPLASLRRRLTAWYVATFGIILTLLGVGLFFVIGHQLSRELDDSLRDATRELVGAARIREMEATGATGRVVDAVDELHIPDRTLYLLDSDGKPIKPDRADAWITQAARRAAKAGSMDTTRWLGEGMSLRLHAERFTLASGAPLVAIAVANDVELEDRYAALIAAFGGAALVATVLVAFGGWSLARKSTEPAERSMEQMRRFMADAAHELRTPLTVLRSRAEFAIRQPQDAASYLAELHGIGAESERLCRIVDDLLILARADAGERPIERQRVFLDDLTLDAADAARVVAQGKGVSMEIDAFEEAPVDGDPALLRQLVMILLDNAVKFTPTGGTVRVGVRGNGGHSAVTVEDSGIGIPPADMAHIFERFYRGDPARTRGNGESETHGAGLGLSIARWIADEHGAEIALTSKVGHGTTVTVEFPVAAEMAT